MGLFVQNHVKNNAQSNGIQYCNFFGNINCNNYQNFNIGDLLLGLTPTLAYAGINALDNIDIGDDGKGGAEDEIQNKIDKLEKKLTDEVYANCGGNAEGLNKAIKNGSEAISSAESKIASFTNGTDEYSVKIKEALELDPNADVSKIEFDRYFALGYAKQELENAKLYKANFEALKGEEENILLEIKRLKNSNSCPEVKYDIQEEAEQLRHFNICLSEFTDIIKYDSGASDKEKKVAAQKLYNAYFGKNSGVPIIDNKTAQKAWGMISVQIDKYLK